MPDIYEQLLKGEWSVGTLDQAPQQPVSLAFVIALKARSCQFATDATQRTETNQGEFRHYPGGRHQDGSNHDHGVSSHGSSKGSNYNGCHSSINA